MAHAPSPSHESEIVDPRARVPKVNLKAINKERVQRDAVSTPLSRLRVALTSLPAGFAVRFCRAKCALCRAINLPVWNESTVKSTFASCCVFFHSAASFNEHLSVFLLVFLSRSSSASHPGCRWSAFLHSRHQATCHLLTSKIGVH